MIRLVLGEDFGLEADLAGRSFGRGAWVHPRRDCLASAAKGGAAKSLKTTVRATEASVFASLRRAADRRAESLLGSARGAGLVAAGAESAEKAHGDRTAVLFVVATDARAAAGHRFVAEAAGAGKAVVWGTKERLGRALGRAETAVVAILDVGFADSIGRAIALSKMPAPGDASWEADSARAEVR